MGEGTRANKSATEEEWKRVCAVRDVNEMARLLRTNIMMAIDNGTLVGRLSWRSKAWFDEVVME